MFKSIINIIETKLVTKSILECLQFYNIRNNKITEDIDKLQHRRHQHTQITKTKHNKNNKQHNNPTSPPTTAIQTSKNTRTPKVTIKIGKAMYSLSTLS